MEWGRCEDNPSFRDSGACFAPLSRGRPSGRDPIFHLSTRTFLVPSFLVFGVNPILPNSEQTSEQIHPSIYPSLSLVRCDKGLTPRLSTIDRTSFTPHTACPTHCFPRQLAVRQRERKERNKNKKRENEQHQRPRASVRGLAGARPEGGRGVWLPESAERGALRGCHGRVLAASGGAVRRKDLGEGGQFCCECPL